MKQKIHLVVQSVIIYLSSLVVTGYSVFVSNQVLVIPLVFVSMDPSLYPDDPFVSTLTHYAAPIWRMIPLLAKLIPLETMLAALFLASRALLMVAAGRLALTLSRGSSLAAVGAMAFFALWPSPFVGSGTLVTPYFEHTSLSLAFLLLAAVSFHQQNPYRWAVWLAIGFNLNSMYGTYACLYFAAAFLFDGQYRQGWKSWLPPGGVFALLASPTIILTASAFQIGAVDRDLWLRASYTRFPYHLYPLTWAPIQFLGFFVFVAFFVAVLYLSRKDLPRLYRHGLVWLGVGLFWLFIAFFAAYVAESPAMLVTHPARGTDLLFAYAAVAIISTLAYYIETDHPKKRLFVFAFFASILWYFLFDYTVFFAVALLAVGLSLVLPFLSDVLLRKGHETRISYVVVLITVIFAAYKISSGSIKEILQNPIVYPDSQIMEIANWAKGATTKGDVFLVNPNWSEFRSLSQRPVFVTWKDGSAILWERSFVEEWTRRMETVGYNFVEPREIGRGPGLEELLDRRYSNIVDDDDAAALASVYNIRYWVVAVDRPSSFNEVFKTQDYKVLEITVPDE